MRRSSDIRLWYSSHCDVAATSSAFPMAAVAPNALQCRGSTLKKKDYAARQLKSLPTRGRSVGVAA
jgi:hypothetical protein